MLLKNKDIRQCAQCFSNPKTMQYIEAECTLPKKNELGQWENI